MIDYKAVGNIDRRTLLGAGICFIFINACEAKSMKARFDVVVFNYLNRPIFGLLIDRTIDAASDKYPATGSGIMTGISLSLSPKKVTWRLDGPPGMKNNSDTITSKKHSRTGFDTRRALFGNTRLS